jgi:hypothetical protein
MKILIVNNDVYELTNNEYFKVLSMHDSKNFTKEEKKSHNFTEFLKWRIHHDKACEYVRKHFKPILTANIIWRDD